LVEQEEGEGRTAPAGGAEGRRGIETMQELGSGIFVWVESSCMNSYFLIFKI
jgi:hypothetical protein